jgi:hypothetical protein
MSTQKKRPVVLTLENLEDRWVPATIQFSNGTLSISNISSVSPAALTVVTPHLKPNSFSVTDGSGSTSTYTNVSSLVIDTGNGKHSVFVNTGGEGYTGTLLIKAHNGNDSITVRGGHTDPTLGQTTIQTGTGNDTVTVAPSTEILGNLTLANSSGSELLMLTVNSIRGNLSISNAASIFLNSLRVAGNTSISSPTLAQSYLNIFAGTFSQNLTVLGGSGSDTVDFLGTPTVNGNTSINLGAGNDSVGITSGTYGGNLGVNTHAGNDRIVFSGATVNGTASFQLGDGNDTVNLAGTMNGDLLVTEGSGNDSVTITSALSGNLTLNLGAGNDTVGVSNPPPGVFFLNAGNGNSSITLGHAGANGLWNINFQFGSGNDTLTLGAAGSTGTLIGSIFSLNSGGNTFLTNNWTIGPPWSSNF